MQGGTVKNLGLKDVDIKSMTTAGSVAGRIESGIIQNCFSDGVVTAHSLAGGIAGIVLKSEIKNCYSRGSVAVEQSPAGGIAGSVGLAGNHVEHCYSAGSVVAMADSGIAGGLIGSTAGLPETPASGSVRQNAALVNLLDGGVGQTARIVGDMGTASESTVIWEQNHAFDGMKVNRAAVKGDDGSGQNGRDGELQSLVMDQAIFPVSDWVLTEGYYPELKIFADKGKQPAPVEYWLTEQKEGRFGIELESPAPHTLPSLPEGYGKPARKTVAVKNTGNDATGELTATLMERKQDGAAKPAEDGDYFILTGAVMDSIAPGRTGSFSISSAAGLKTGTYTARIRIDGKYGLSAICEVRFTVYMRDDSDDAVSKKPPYTILNGNVPSSAGTGTWERQPGGGWKFHKKSGLNAGSAGTGVSLAVREWLLIDGFWYVFDEDGRMVTGWACINGVWYYLSTADYAGQNRGGSRTPDGSGISDVSRLKEGAMVTGWLLDPVTGLWYWLDTNGAMAVGWREIDGRQYYFNPESDGTRGKLMKDEEIKNFHKAGIKY